MWLTQASTLRKEGSQVAQFNLTQNIYFPTFVTSGFTLGERAPGQAEEPDLSDKLHDVYTPYNHDSVGSRRVGWRRKVSIM